MTSVLYYIYNGEVVLLKSKLRLFLEIIQAMQIYIDCQYLSKIQEDVEDKYFEFERNNETISLHSEIFTLAFDNDEDQHIFNIKKCKESQGAFLKYSQSDLDYDDNAVRCQNESEPGESRLGNLKSPYEDRQRNSLLRDLFIETYPPNGNVNGLTESVLAISNKYYQSPASVLLANANCRHLSIDDALARHSKKSNGHALHSSAVGEGGLQRARNRTKECGEVPTSDPLQHIVGSTNITNSTLIYSKNVTYSDVNKFIPITSDKGKLHASFDSINKLVSNPMEYQVNKNTEHLTLDHAEYHSIRTRTESNIQCQTSKKVIFNHVLESPWSSRKPNNYRPFRRKDKDEDFPNSKVILNLCDVCLVYNIRN